MAPHDLRSTFTRAARRRRSESDREALDKLISNSTFFEAV